MLKRDFFSRKPEIVARDLLGKIIVRKDGGRTVAAIVVETEAYLGLGDKASHSFKGKTLRNEVMFGPAGFSYVYFTYGMHWLLNFVTEDAGKPSAVLVRAVEPLYDSARDLSGLPRGELIRLGAGPARLTKWMGIGGDLNREDVTESEDFYVTNKAAIDGNTYLGKKKGDFMIEKAPRIGVDYAGEHKDLLLRFYIKSNPYVSRK